MAEMHRVYGTDFDVEIGETWRPQWQLVSRAGWVTADTVFEVFQLHKDLYDPFTPFILARYETCAVGNKHGVYRPMFMPTIDAEDAPIVRNLEIVAVLNPQDYPDDELYGGKKYGDCFEINEFMP